MIRPASCLLVLFAAASANAKPAGSPLASPQAKLLQRVNFEQRLDAQAPVTLRFRDDRGDAVSLRECMSGRPTILVLAYYRCPMLCNQVLNGVARSLKAIDFRPGRDFEIVVVSFDPTDTIELAAAKKDSVVAAYRGASGTKDGDGWHFLIGREKDVGALADSVGFQYRYDPSTKQFAHASGIVLLTPTGRVSKYFYGIEYPTRDLRLGLIDASAGRIGSRVDQILLYCFHYDPLTGRYGLAILRLVRAAGALTVAAIACFIGFSLRRERLERRRDINAASRGASTASRSDAR